MKIGFETMVSKQMEIETYKKIIKGLKLYFDVSNIDMMKVQSLLGTKKRKRFEEALDLMWKEFKIDE